MVDVSVKRSIYVHYTEHEKLSGIVWTATTSRDWNESFTLIEHRPKAVGREGLVHYLNRHFSSPSGFQSSLLPIYFCNGPNSCLHCDKEWKKPVWYVTIHFQYQQALSFPEPPGGLRT